MPRHAVAVLKTLPLKTIENTLALGNHALLDTRHTRVAVFGNPCQPAVFYICICLIGCFWCVCSRNVGGGDYGAEPSHRNPNPLWAGQEPEAREAHAVPGRWRDRPQSHGGRRRSGQSQEVGRDVPHPVSYFPQSVFYHEPRTKPVTNHLFPNALNRDHANKVQLLECVCICSESGPLSVYSLCTENPRPHISEDGTRLSAMASLWQLLPGDTDINGWVGCRSGAFSHPPVIHALSRCSPTDKLLKYPTREISVTRFGFRILLHLQSIFLLVIHSRLYSCLLFWGMFMVIFFSLFMW